MKLNYLTLHYDAASLASYVGAGTSLLGDVFNLFGSSQANREQRQWAVTQQQQQRDWALEDIKNQNIYNSPVEQMNRLKQAGLNPNMVYGTGVTGSTGQQQQQPRPAVAPPYNPQNTLSGFANLGSQIASAIATYNSITQTQAEIKNLGQTYTGLGLDNARKTIDNVIIGSSGRADPSNTEIYRTLDLQQRGHEERKMGNEARASDILPQRVTLDFNLIQDENKRAWAKNTREEALNKPTVQMAIQSISNAVEQNALIRQQTQVGAAQFQEIMQKTAQMGQNMTDPSNKQNAADLIDYLLLILALKNKGGTTPQKGFGNPKSINPNHMQSDNDNFYLPQR